MAINDVIGAPGTIRTSDPQIRSLMLYPAELRARVSHAIPGLTAHRHSVKTIRNGRERAL